MKEEIIKFIKDNPGQKGRVIARELGFNKTDVNSLLYHSTDDFKQNDGGWYLTRPHVLTIHLPDVGWVNGEGFDDALSHVEDAFESTSSDIEFVFPRGGTVLLEAAARLLAFAN